MRAVTIIAAVSLISACGGSSDNDSVTQTKLWQVSGAEISTAPLQPVSGEQLAQYLKYGLYAGADADGSIPAPAEPGASGTNLITRGVDEADRVKFSNNLLYVSGIDSSSDKPYLKRWLRAEDSSLSALPPLALAPQIRQITGLYVSDEQLTVLGNNRYGYAGIALSPPPGVPPQGEITVQLFEQGNSAYQLQFDGDLIDSRRTADALWLVSRYRPQVAGYLSYALTVAEKQNNMRVLAAATLNDLLPARRLNGGTAEPLILSGQCYLPADAQTDEGSAGMIVLTRISTAAPYQTESSCIVGAASELYMSAEHLYLHGSVWQPDGMKTVLHKFSLDDSAAGYQATGAVSGQILGSQSAFMLQEKDQYLMLFSTIGGQVGPMHRFWVLEQQSNVLSTVAQLPNAQEPGEVIGKPGEDIYGVRFVNDRAYVVTFERTDPLYTLDLTNPLQPTVIGELEIPGYSAYLHSVTDDLLWGLGQQIETNARGEPVWNSVGAKVALFDVSANDAVVRDELIFAEQYSPLEYQHHSLAVQQYANGSRMALPLSRYVNGSGEQVSLLLLDISQNGIMQKTGELMLEPGPFSGSWDARPVLVNDDIYFVVADTVYHSYWHQPEQVVTQYR